LQNSARSEEVGDDEKRAQKKKEDVDVEGGV
jgi:hypothetical protein